VRCKRNTDERRGESGMGKGRDRALEGWIGKTNGRTEMGRRTGRTMERTGTEMATIHMPQSRPARLTVPRLCRRVVGASDVTASCVSARVSDHAETYRRTADVARGPDRIVSFAFTPCVEPSQSKSTWDVGEGAVTAAGRPVDGAPGPWCHWSTASICVPLGVERQGDGKAKRTIQGGLVINEGTNLQRSNLNFEPP
jgi:hypothetical protein